MGHMPCFRVITNKTPNGIPITAPKNKAIDTIYMFRTMLVITVHCLNQNQTYVNAPPQIEYFSL